MVVCKSSRQQVCIYIQPSQKMTDVLVHLLLPCNLLRCQSKVKIMWFSYMWKGINFVSFMQPMQFSLFVHVLFNILVLKICLHTFSFVYVMQKKNDPGGQASGMNPNYIFKFDCLSSHIPAILYCNSRNLPHIDTQFTNSIVLYCDTKFQSFNLIEVFPYFRALYY